MSAFAVSRNAGRVPATVAAACRADRDRDQVAANTISPHQLIDAVLQQRDFAASLWVRGRIPSLSPFVEATVDDAPAAWLSDHRLRHRRMQGRPQPLEPLSAAVRRNTSANRAKRIPHRADSRNGLPRTPGSGCLAAARQCPSRGLNAAEPRSAVLTRSVGELYAVRSLGIQIGRDGTGQRSRPVGATEWLAARHQPGASARRQSRPERLLMRCWRRFQPAMQRRFVFWRTFPNWACAGGTPTAATILPFTAIRRSKSVLGEERFFGGLKVRLAVAKLPPK